MSRSPAPQLAQFVAARILDGDDRLIGEGCAPLDLALAEQLYALARKPECANCFAFAKQRHAQDRPVRASCPATYTADMFTVGANVRYLNRTALCQRPADGRPRPGAYEMD